MTSVPDPRRRLLPFPPLPTIFVRVTTRSPHAGTRRDIYVTIERQEDDTDEKLIVKAIRSYHRLHGHSEQVVGVDLVAV